MEEANLIYASNRKCGTNPCKVRKFVCLTPTGVHIMTSTPALYARDKKQGAAKTEDGMIKGNHYRSDSLIAKSLRQDLFDLAQSKKPCDQDSFRELLFEAVISGDATPLTAAIAEAATVNISTEKYSLNQIYNIWRMSHITAMFRMNQFLTYLDRRPYNTHFAIDGIVDEKSYQKYISQFGQTPASITYKALNKWYEDNPFYYRLDQYEPDDSDAFKQKWKTTPAFYATRELPEFDSVNSFADAQYTPGTQNIMQHTFVGLATGVRANYLCYHAKTGIFKWNVKREERAISAVESSLKFMQERCPDFTCFCVDNAPKVHYGLIFCTTFHQFVAIFDRTKKRHQKGLLGNYATSEPFASLHVIPVNYSGTYLLRCLLLSSPTETEQILRNALLRKGGKFTYEENRIYPLRYHGQRVFLGYTMNIEHINMAYEDYLDGHRFYIACFPEQALYYSWLMPDCPFV